MGEGKGLNILPIKRIFMEILKNRLKKNWMGKVSLSRNIGKLCHIHTMDYQLNEHTAASKIDDS